MSFAFLLAALMTVAPSAGTAPVAETRGEGGLWSVGPPPTWASPTSVDTLLSHCAKDVRYLLFEWEIDARTPDFERHAHRALYFAEDADVHDASDISVEFDPEYEHVVLHDVLVLRDGERTSQLDTCRIEVHSLGRTRRWLDARISSIFRIRTAPRSKRPSRSRTTWPSAPTAEACT